jgi:homoserine dehydrogenase
VADLVSVATGTAGRAFEELLIWPDRTPPAVQLPAGAVRSRYYFRADVQDHPGVLAQIATIFAQHDISISSVLQHEPPGGKEGDRVPLVITTHTALGADAAKARAQVDGLGAVKAPSVCVPIVEEYPEQL